MPKPKALTPEQARRTLAHRFGPRVDRLRQLATRFGIRPYRCFLVWVAYSGAERGEGEEREVSRVEILPTPRVGDLTSAAYRPWSAGTLPEGTIRVDRISVLFTSDHLRGLRIPDGLPPSYYAHRRAEGELVGGTIALPADDPQRDFFWEIREDGRTGDLPERQRFRVYGRPFRDAGNVSWTMLLEPASEPLDRDGKPVIDQLTVTDADDT